MELTRREAVQRLTVLVGGALSAPSLSALLSGCSAAPPEPGWSARVLSPEQLALLDVAVDRIIPPTDTPGARAVGVPAFIDTLLDRWAEPDERTRFLTGLDELDTQSRAMHGAAFLEATAEQQSALLVMLDEEAVRAREEDADPLPFFATLKEWTVVGYYTSEAGATQELNWLAVPGRYDADLPLEQVGRTWA